MAEMRGAARSTNPGFNSEAAGLDHDCCSLSRIARTLVVGVCAMLVVSVASGPAHLGILALAVLMADVTVGVLTYRVQISRSGIRARYAPFWEKQIPLEDVTARYRGAATRSGNEASDSPSGAYARSWPEPRESPLINNIGASVDVNFANNIFLRNQPVHYYTPNH
jgi:hypothetical protein